MLLASLATAESPNWNVHKMDGEIYVEFSSGNIFRVHQSQITDEGIRDLKKFKVWLDQVYPTYSLSIFASSDQISAREYWSADPNPAEQSLIVSRATRVRDALVGLNISPLRISEYSRQLCKVASEKLDLISRQSSSKLLIILQPSPESIEK